MPYCQKVSIRVRDSLIMEEISFFLCVVCVPASSTGAYRMKTEVTVVKCWSTTLGPVRLDQQTGSPCYGTIICTLQLELSSLKHGISTEHIPTIFKMSDSYVSFTESFLRLPVLSNPYRCNIFLQKKTWLVFLSNFTQFYLQRVLQF
jgi:hypothetical protein